MAKRGRPRKAANLVALEGRRQDPSTAKPTKRPVAEVKAPKMPAGLPKLAERWWKRTIPKLIEMGTVSEADQDALEAAARAWNHWQKLEEILESTGYETSDDRGNDKVSPYVEAARRAEQRFMQIAAHFGMTPLSRSRIELPPVVQEQAQEKKQHGVSEDLLDS